MTAKAEAPRIRPSKGKTKGRQMSTPPRPQIKEPTARLLVLGSCSSSNSSQRVFPASYWLMGQSSSDVKLRLDLRQAA